MNSPRSRLHHVLTTASVATLGTTVAAALWGRHENGSVAAPLNATSHILWGDRAARHDEIDLEHTAVGTGLNAGAMLAWSAVLEGLLGPWVRRGSLARAATAGVAISALAYVTDYYLVPSRLTPGFEKRLSPFALGSIYAVLAGTLAAGAAITSAHVGKEQRA